MRLLAELRNKELEAERAQTEKEAAEAKAALATSLARTAQQLRRSNDELRELASITHHDLQTPLHTVVRSCQFALMRTRDELDAECRDNLSAAMEAARQMKELIDAVRTLVDIGSSPGAPCNTPANELVATALRQLKPLVRETGARIHVADLPSIRVQRREFEQVFFNLLENALRYRSDCDPEIFVEVAEDQSAWVFAVRDNGIGVRPNRMGDLFRPLRRGGNLRTDARRGMGLALAKKVVETHGGSIWGESVEGAGATFSFTVPKIPVETEAPDTAFASQAT